MNERRYVFTSESVTEGHPDKVSDQVSDAVLDAILVQDPTARVACETLVTTGNVVVAGEITAHGTVDIEAIARKTIAEIGYDAATGFDPDTVRVHDMVHPQSPDIAQGVDVGGAGDQGMMFGFACTETPELMPAPIQWAHRLAQQMARVRKDGTLPYLRPDGKTQVTVVYEDHHPVRIDKVLLSSHHAADVKQEQIRADLLKYVVKPIMEPLGMLDDETTFLVNPTGAFTVGGPVADTGVTGRKIIVDTYGGMGRHGGGAFSGKDATKVDRSAAYMMRYLAKNLVAAGVAERLELEIAYAIGEAAPMGVFVETFGTGRIADEKIVEIVRANIDLTPAGIIKQLDLRRPQFRATAAYGHFGRTDLDVRWEQTDLAAELARAAGTEPIAALA
ncbi:MAG TPA: methionine adenosyltransferase [Armatimonadota bacterium]|nr:methionine adenosyltransferase [Armatimonadota bacterium]